MALVLVAMHYRPRPHLLVYCNFWSGVGLEREANRIADRIVAPHRDGFQSAWLLFSQEAVVRLWPDPCTVRMGPSA
jgi:hypothetical protein